MSFVDILLTAFSLSLDAVALAAAAAALKQIEVADALKIAFFFGGFQLVMPLIGWALGLGVASYVVQYGHIVGFVLLVCVGIKMLYEALRKKDSDDVKNESHLAETSTLIVMAVATSIDALVVGATFSFVPVNLPIAVSVIGAVTFLLSLAAIQFGKVIHRYVGNEIELGGGLVLIVLAFKILLF